MKCSHIEYEIDESNITKRTKHICKKCGAFRFVKDGIIFKWIEPTKLLTGEFL